MLTITKLPRFINKIKIPSRISSALLHNLDTDNKKYNKHYSEHRLYSITKEKNTNSIIHSNSLDIDVGLQDYMKKVSRTTGTFIGITALSGAATVAITPMLVNYPMILATGYISAVAGTIYTAYKFDSSKTDDEKMKKALALHIGMGVMISPSLFVFSQFIPHALVTTSACVMGPIAASFYLPKGKLLKYGPVLYTGLFGLIGVGFLGISANLLGFSNVGAALHSIDLYGGIALFMAYNAYDTHVMIKEYEDGKLDHINHAANYSLNSINIFIRLLEVFSKVSNPSSSK